MNEKLNDINHIFLKNLYFLWGVIDGVLQGVQKEKEKIDDPFILKIIEEQEKEWKRLGKEIISKIESEKIKRQEGN